MEEKLMMMIIINILDCCFFYIFGKFFFFITHVGIYINSIIITDLIKFFFETVDDCLECVCVYVCRCKCDVFTINFWYQQVCTVCVCVLDQKNKLNKLKLYIIMAINAMNEIASQSCDVEKKWREREGCKKKHIF